MPKLLDAYRKKRDFSKTPEPAPKAGKAKGFAFVVQKHDATRLHYDFRIELDGVMKSWAVTRGPSLVPTDKRLAVQTEDHPIAYNSFEGIIPKDQYGGGTVMIWDRGTWQPEGDPHKGLKKGHLEFSLHGEKLSGRWHLVRMKKKAREKAEPWLLIKSDDEAARTARDKDILKELDRSVVSGRTIPEIAAKKERVWKSKRGDSVNSTEEKKPKTAKSKTAKKSEALIVHTGKKAKLPDFVEPQLATLVAKARSGENWLHEVKFDGYRLQARLKNGKVKLLTRNGLDWSHRFPNICAGIKTLPVGEALIDGEAVVEDETGASSFSALQQDLGGRGGKLVAGKAIYYAFDLLHLNEHDLRALPLLERKTALQALVEHAPADKLRFSEHFATEGDAMLEHACRLGLEGIISKRADAPYKSGRNDNWLKVKCTQSSEFVIGGYVPSTVSAGMIGSLVMGYYEKGKLVYAGRVGTGYTQKIARNLKKAMDKVKADASSFAEKLSADERRGVIWVKPKLVAEVEFRGWTQDGSLRHASFKGLREDKDPKSAVREVPKDMPEPKAKAKMAQIKKGVAVAGVNLSHPERVLWDDEGVTKQGLAEFYAEIADWILPHLVDRPLSLVRCPSGASAKCFFQKHAWAGLGPGIREIDVPGDDEKMLAIKDISGLISLVQAGVLEIHPWGSKQPKLTMPDRLIFDLDPGDGVAWSGVVAAARDVRERMNELGLESFVKTTGGKGLHVVVPLKPDVAWDEAKAFTKVFAEQMAGDSPELYVSTMSKKIRKGRVFVDYLRNGQGATAVAAYSTRARPGAPVATPSTGRNWGPI
ncbi:ATP-dependent DNA ligase [Terrihabitans soli]|uniref:DNA ligase (ATP) n=1 Tax=Terrihabitans soli TaxID=708113 RepID=A0A6S6QYC3_9HYPH|nr:ATP-dependent DNA ligase [Terrihabitans soli]